MRVLSQNHLGLLKKGHLLRWSIKIHTVSDAMSKNRNAFLKKALAMSVPQGPVVGLSNQILNDLKIKLACG
ncbi:MAG: hypothetical protein ACXVCY_14855 [Pseudobdellovibrionaceae bacterium]